MRQLMTAGDWGLWMAVAALIAGGGKFLDDYHIRAMTKSRTREVLTRWFVWLDSVTIPDLAAAVLNPVRALIRYRVLLTLAFLLTGYWAVTTVFYIARLREGAESDSYWEYIYYWVLGSGEASRWLLFIGIILTAALTGAWAMVAIVQVVTRVNQRWKRILLLIGAMFGGPFISVACAAIILVAFGLFGPYALFFFLAAAVAPLLPLTLILIVLFLMMVRFLVSSIRWILLHVFESASAPTISPFAYLGALLGLITLGAKVAQEALP